MEFPQSIDSKFRYILVAARRAHQLHAGSKTRVQSESDKVTVIAQREVCAGLVPFKINVVPGNHHENLQVKWQPRTGIEFTPSRAC